MKEKFRNFTSTIRFKLIVIFTILFLIPFVFVETIIYSTIEERALRNTNEQMVNSLRLVSDYTTTLLSDIQTDFQNIIFREDFILALFDVRDLGKITTSLQLNTTEKLADDFAPFIENTSIHSVYLYNESNHVFYDFSYLSPGYLEENITTTTWYKTYETADLADASRRNTWLLNTSIPNIGHQEPVSIISHYTRFQAASGDITVLSVNVDIKELTDIVNALTLPDNTHAYIADVDNNIVASNIDSYIGKNLNILYPTTPDNNTVLTVNNSKRYISSYDSTTTDYHFIIDVPYSYIISAASESRTLLYGLYLAIIGIIVIMNFFIQRLLLRPIQAMVDKMRHVEQGDFNITLPDNRNDEMGILYRNFNDMTRNIHTLIEKNYVEALLRKQSDLNYIQTQLNEHFLYNTLDAIHGLIMMNDKETARDMLMALSHFFRTTLNNGKKVITIDEIAKMLENYIAIIHLRNSGKYKITIDVTPSLLDCYALKFLFQPILENAIIHGVGKRRFGGEINVCIQEKDDKICYTVWDNGPGIPEDVLNKLDALIASDSPSFESEYFALNNIVNQAKLFYKDDFHMIIDTKVNQYTSCSIYIPVLTSVPKEGELTDDNSHSR